MSAPSKTFPVWALFSLAANGLLVIAIAWAQLREDRWSLPSPVSQSVAATHSSHLAPDSPPGLGARLHLNYQQWVNLIGREAEIAAVQQPQHLSILLGDSLSLWFPTELLPADRYWLNQGISGETSAGLLNRLELIDQTQPEVIYVMIGINDLIRGVRGQTILANQELIVRYLRRVHPKTKIVIQSILPHSAEEATWEGRDRLLAIPNTRIQELNERLKAIAEAEGAIYLDLYPLFADANGNLKTELSTDGLHLSPQGYLVWRNAMLVLNELLLGKS